MPTVDISHNGKLPVRYWGVSQPFLDKLIPAIDKYGWDAVVTVIPDYPEVQP